MKSVGGIACRSRSCPGSVGRAFRVPRPPGPLFGPPGGCFLCNGAGGTQPLLGGCDSDLTAFFSMDSLLLDSLLLSFFGG